jgi:NitT/TauT family transport system substrate-binding protein
LTRIRPVAFLLLAALACSREQVTTPAGAAKPLTKVRANLNPTITYAPFMIAKDEGFFAEEGLDVELVRVDANSSLMAVTTGGLDVMSGPIRSGLFNVMLRDPRVRVVADRGRLMPRSECVVEAFAAPVAIAERIKSKHGDVRGEKFALIRGGFTEYMIDAFLTQRKLTRKDISFVQIPPGDSAESAKRQIDAVRYVQEPNLSNGIAKGLYEIVAPAESVVARQQHGLVLYGKRFLRDEPELGHRFMRAYLRGVRRYSEGKTKRNVAIIAAYTKLPEEIIRRSCWLPFAEDGSVDMPSTNALLDWSLAQGYLDAKVPVEKWWDPRFVDAARLSPTR